MSSAPGAARPEAAVAARRVLCWLLLALFAAAWFGPLGYRKLVRPDEGRYAEISREMALGGDWLTPRLNGIKYFEKPPLQYWATAAAFRAWGTHEWTARLWTALTGFLCVLIVAATSGRLWGARSGVLAGAVAASLFLLNGIGHFNTLDMGLAFFMQGALSAFLLAQRHPPGSRAARAWAAVLWVSLALAVLSKGIVALALAGGTLVLYSLLNRDARPWPYLEWKIGVPLFLAAAAPWFVAVSIANPEFPRFFFIHEHFERFLTTEHKRYEPAWFFIPILLGGALPWTTLLPQALLGAWRSAAPKRAAMRFLVIYVALVFAFFSASGSKLASYILPLFPALAMLLGDWLSRASPRSLAAHWLAVAAIALACLAIIPVADDLARSSVPSDQLAAYSRWLVAAAILWGAGTVMAALLARKERLTASVLVLALASFVGENGVLLGHDTLNRSSSAYAVSREVRPLLAPDTPFYSVATYDQTLPFYLGRTVTLVAYHDEFSFGLAHEPGRDIPTIEAFKKEWNRQPRAFAFMLPGVYDTLRAQGLPMQVVASDPRRVIVKKP